MDVVIGTSTQLLYARPGLMGDRLWAGMMNHLRYASATEADSAFYPPRDGK